MEMTDPQHEFRVWLAEQMKAAGRGVRQKLAEHLGIRPDAISRMVTLDPTKESREIKAHELTAIRDFFGVPDLTPQQPAPLISWVSAGALAVPDYVPEAFDEVPLVYDSDLDPNGDWIALRVDGRSMDKISPHDSIIFVNLNEKTLIPNACYIIGDGNGGATYKRYRPPNIFEAVSTKSEQYPTITFESDPWVIGRVRKTVLNL